MKLNPDKILQTEFGVSKQLSSTLLQQGVVRHLTKSTCLGTQGETPAQLILVLSGSLVLTRDNPDATEQLAGVLAVGNLFYESYFYHSQASNVHVHTLTDSTCLLVPAKHVYHLIDNNIEFNKLLATSISRKFQILGSLAHVGNEREMTSKVYKALYYNFQCCNLTQIPITITQFASMLGMSRNTVSKALKVCESKGAIELQPGNIVIKDALLLLELGMADSEISM